MFLTDNRTVFIYNGLKQKSLQKDTLTQFGYACKELGVEIETTLIQEKKSRIERLFKTLQSHLINELKTAGIQSIEEANKFLVNFTKDYNEKFALPINYSTSVFEKVDFSLINSTLSIRSLRKFDRGCSISYNNKHYLAYKDGKQINYVRKTECMVIETYDKRLLCNVDNEMSELFEIENFQEYSKEFDSENLKLNLKKVSTFLQQVIHIN